MRLNLKLAHKALILIAIPLVCELLLVYQLSSMLREAELETRREQHAKEIVVCGSSLVSCLLGAAKALASLAFTSDKKKSLDRYHQAVDAVPDLFKRLKALTAGTDIDMRELDKLEDVSNRIMAITDDAVLAAQNGSAREGLHRLTQLKPLLQECEQQIEVVSRQARRVEEESPKIQALARHRMQMVLYVAIIFNVLVAVALALFYTKSTTGRLRILMDNTRRLSAGQQLLPGIQGSDEIAHLDQTFHDMAAALAAAKAKEDEINRMKQDFLSMVSHDLRTPLTSVQIFLHLLTSEAYGSTNPEIAGRAEAAERNVARLVDMVSNLLNMEKLEEGSVELDRRNTQVSQLFEQAVDSLREFADRHEVTIVVEPCDATIFVDNDRMVQVLVNLLSNAIKFSPQGGSVRLIGRADSDFLEISVVDQGRGIPENMREAIFQKYKQVEGADATHRKGTGLGLAIARALVETHGGTLGVTSEEGKGSTFWLRLPMVAEQITSQSEALQLNL